MSKTVLLIGCGELGSRHLQAAVSLSEISEIYIVEPNSSSIERGKTRINEVSDLNPKIKFKWFNNLEDAPVNGDLCIVATQAGGRAALIKQASELGYQNFFIEKIVTQSVSDYQSLLDLAAQKGLKVWVNCKTRAYGVHKYIKSCLDPNAPIVFTDMGGNHGLANNGVHSVDLFVFYDGSENLISSGSRIDQVLHKTKRGLLDLSGTFNGHTEKGSDFMVSFAGSHNSPDHISIVSSKCRFIVDHFQKFAWESHADKNWKWQNIPIDDNWSVSFMSKAFIQDILNNNTCELPTLLDCYPAHKFILSELQPHFNMLTGEQNDYCPVT
ncbi:MAG: Gfo/Idh/MocA family oxidoreductase [Candidatus Margulisiibacteriota bacterium]